MIKIPEKFKTSDGITFDDQLKAECHEECVKAAEALELAELRFFEAIAQRHFKTADGHPFSFKGDKWIIVEPAFEPPYVMKVELYWHSSQMRYSFRPGDAELCVSWKDGNKAYEKPISSFYASERAANLEAIERRKRHLQWWEEDLEKKKEMWGVADALREAE